MDYCIVLPSCGRSTRFPTRPKWSLTMPDGQLMLSHSICGLRSSPESKLYIGLLSEQVNNINLDVDKIRLNLNSEIFVLDNDQTDSHAKTVFSIISNIKNDCGLFIKDVDNYFNTNLDDYFRDECGCLSVIYANKIGISADNKSTICLDKDGFVKKIYENNWLNSDIICVGGYAFPKKNIFVDAFNSLYKRYAQELKISGLVNLLINNGVKFRIKEVGNYIDYGTYESWLEYKNNFSTLFIDLDGVLVENGSEYFGNKWENTQPIIENINAINKDNFYVVITSSRPESMMDVTIKQLNNFGIKYNRIILGLPSCKRVLINDLSDGNKTTSAYAINTNRNAKDLAEQLNVK
jgi:hypothetical protein